MTVYRTFCDTCTRELRRDRDKWTEHRDDNDAQPRIVCALCEPQPTDTATELRCDVCNAVCKRDPGFSIEYDDDDSNYREVLCNVHSYRKSCVECGIEPPPPKGAAQTSLFES